MQETNLEKEFFYSCFCLGGGKDVSIKYGLKQMWRTEFFLILIRGSISSALSFLSPLGWMCNLVVAGYTMSRMLL